MTIADIREKSKAWLQALPRDVLVLCVLLAASGLSFILGYLSGKDAGQGSTPPESIQEPLDLSSEATTSGQFVGSKNGTKYYRSGCAGASRIADKNKVWFDSAEHAQAAGYTAAANCAGI